MERKEIVSDYYAGREFGMRFARANELKLKRVVKYMGNGFFTMSAFRSDKLGGTAENNEENHWELCSIIKSNGLGFITLFGSWRGKDGESADEVSLFIPYKDVMSREEFDSFAKNLCVKYEQDTYIIDNGDGKVLLKDKNGEVMASRGNMKTSADFCEIYSQLKSGKDSDKNYLLEGIRTWNGMYAAQWTFDSGEIV